MKRSYCHIWCTWMPSLMCESSHEVGWVLWSIFKNFPEAGQACVFHFTLKESVCVYISEGMRGAHWKTVLRDFGQTGPVDPGFLCQEQSLDLYGLFEPKTNPLDHSIQKIRVLLDRMYSPFHWVRNRKSYSFLASSWMGLPLYSDLSILLSQNLHIYDVNMVAKLTKFST